MAKTKQAKVVQLGNYGGGTRVVTAPLGTTPVLTLAPFQVTWVNTPADTTAKMLIVRSLRAGVIVGEYPTAVGTNSYTLPVSPAGSYTTQVGRDNGQSVSWSAVSNAVTVP